jgi:hypothetical protein
MAAERPALMADGHRMTFVHKPVLPVCPVQVTGLMLRELSPESLWNAE